MVEFKLILGVESSDDDEEKTDDADDELEINDELKSKPGRISRFFGELVLLLDNLPTVLNCKISFSSLVILRRFPAARPSLFPLTSLHSHQPFFK